jgi:putative nucleotidyltransferase with HDIG domain
MFKKLSVCTDTPQKRDAIRRRIGDVFELTFLDLDEIHAAPLQPQLLFDVNFSDSPRLINLKQWLNGQPKGGKVVFVTDKASHIQAIQAKALGATDVVHHPLNAGVLMKKLLASRDAILRDGLLDPIKDSPGVGAALDALHGIFSTACLGAPLDAAAINSAGESIIGHIEEHGLRSWIKIVRRHHSQTYQHCLLVTGVAVAFGQHLGFSVPDRRRLSFAAMLHDIGKARVPIDILEKPTALSEEEMTIMRMHPEFGLETLKSTEGLSPDMLDVVIHHHEYLDGSGYPHGLSGNEISDFVRIATICDTFGALLERRAYKPPIPGDVAYQMLLDMGPKLDKDLMREFRFAAALRFEERV